MKVNEHIVTQVTKIIKRHVCPKCGSENWIEHFADHPEDKPYDVADCYHWYCMDCGYKDYDYIIF